MRKHYTCLYHSAEHSDDVCKKSCEVGNGALEENDTDGPAAAKLSPDAGDGGNARRVQQAEDERKDRKLKNGISVAGIVIPIVVTIWGTLKTLKFEETGTVTTIMGRGFIQKLLPKK